MSTVKIGPNRRVRRRVWPSGSSEVANPTALMWAHAIAGLGTAAGGSVAIDGGNGWYNVFAVNCNTRLNAAVAQGLAGTDFYGTNVVTPSIQQTFGTRSQLEYRTDWLDFSGSDAYRWNGGGSADCSASAACLRLNPGWRIKQIAQAASATVTATATFASPVSAGSYVIAAVAMLSANSVVTGPVGGSLLGGVSEANQRTSRIAVYGVGSMAGQSARSVTVNSTTGGVALGLYEISFDDPLEVVFETAVKAQANLLAYWPMQETLGGARFKSFGGSLDVSTNSGGVWTPAYQAGPDGRSYPRHVVSTNGSPVPDNDAWSPSVGAAGLTLGGWFRFESLASVQTLFAKYGGSGAREYVCDVQTDGSIIASTTLSDGTAARTVTAPAGTIVTNTWYLIFLRLGTTTTSFPSLRVNGSNFSSTSNSGTSMGNGTFTLQIGSRSTTVQALVGAAGKCLAYSGVKSDADCQLLEAAAQTEGLY